MNSAPWRDRSRVLSSRGSQWLSHWLMIVLAMLWTVLVLVGCNSRSSSAPRNSDGSPVSAGAKLEVVVTTGMVRDLVDSLLDDDIRVTAIMGPGVDPHLHQPTRTDAVRISGADLVVYNGLHLEGRLGEVLESRAKFGKPTIAVGDQLDPDQLLDADAGLHDPHIWMDVALWAEAADGVARELIQWQPGRAESIEKARRRLNAQLTALDQWSEQTLATIPDSQRVLITAHDAFRYFGRRYNLEVHGVQGISTMSEAAISDANRLVDLIVTRHVPAVFFETSVSQRQVKAIVEGARQRGMTVSSDATLYSDSLGAEASEAGTYLGMIQANVRTIANALGGQTVPFELPEEALESDLESDAVAREVTTEGRLGESS